MIMGHSTYKISVDSKGKAICKIGKQCGDICIPKRKKCKDTRGEAAALVKELQGVRKELSELRNELRSMRSGNNTPQKPSQELQKSLDKTSNAIANSVDISKVAAVGAIAGMSLIALPPAGYLAFRANYHNNFNKSAEEAKNIANEIKDDIPNDLKGGYKGTNGDTPANQITFVVGGFAGQGGENSLQYAQQFAPNRGSVAQNTLKQSAEDASDSPDLFEDHHVVAINNRDFEIRPSGKREKVSIPIPFTDQTITDGTTEQFKTMLETSVVKGSNPVSIELAAKAYAYRQKHPDKPINLMGYSAGGMVTHEAAHILEKMGVKDVRVANFGSPYWGLTDKVGQSVTFASENDPVVSQGGVAIRDPILVNKVANHFAYLQNPDTRRHLANFFDRSKSNVKPNQDVWVPGVTPTPKEQSSNLTPGSKSKPKEGETEAEYNARVVREKKRQRREDPAVQAELQRKMQERASRQAASKNDSFTYHLSRLDAIKKATCKVGKQCGDVCIPKKKKCTGDRLKQKKPSLDFSPLITAGITVAGIAAVTGLTVAGLKMKHDSGINLAAKSIKDNPEFVDSVEVSPVKINNSNPIIYTASGLGVADSEVSKFYNDEFGDDSYGREVSNALGKEGYNYISLPLKFNQVKENTGFDEAVKKYVTPLLEKGYNPDAYELAKHVYYQHQLNPNNQIYLSGHSAGSVVTNHAQEILDKLGVQSTVINSHGYYSGIENLKPQNNVTILGRSDAVVKPFYSHNPTMIDGEHNAMYEDPDGENGYQYRNWRNELLNQFNSKRKTR
jgi:alpha/beta superfamily hydrolase